MNDYSYYNFTFTIFKRRVIPFLWRRDQSSTVEEWAIPGNPYVLYLKLTISSP